MQVDPKVIASIYDELEAMKVALDYDPRVQGLRVINSKMAQVRNHLTSCQNWFTRISKDYWQLKRELTVASAAFEMTLNDLLANDPEVRAERNLPSQKAKANVIAKEEVAKLNELKLSLLDLEMLLEVLKAKTKDLMDMQNRIKDQYRVTLDEIKSLGLKWGNPDSIVPDDDILDKCKAHDLVPGTPDPMEELMKEFGPLPLKEDPAPGLEIEVPNIDDGPVVIQSPPLVDSSETSEFDLLLSEIPDEEVKEEEVEKPEEVDIDSLLSSLF